MPIPRSKLNSFPKKLFIHVALATALASLSPTPAFTAITDTVRQHPTNARYFQNIATGKGVYLAGSHNWNVLDSTVEIPGQSNFDYIDYLDFMQERNHNFLRLWTNSNSKLVDNATPIYLRSGTCCANDGGAKWDLTDSWNQTYFDKMRDVVEAARVRDIYVGIMFDEGWWIKQADQANSNSRWQHHPFNPANNIHTQTAGLTKQTLHTLNASSFVLERQRAYITKVIDTVDELDNVVYEIVNEDEDGTMAWQENMVSHTRTQTIKPVGITSRTADNNPELFSSSANWTSPDDYAGQSYIDNPPSATQGKVVISDTDHLWGIGGDSDWVWRTFTRGLHPIFMDPYFRTGGNYQDFQYWEDLRWAMGDTLAYAQRVNDIALLNPREDLCQTTYCLTDPGNYYIIFSRTSNSFWVDLLPGTYYYEWFHTRSRDLRGSGQITVSSGRRTFTPPSARLTLYLEKINTVPTNPPTITSSPSPTPSRTPTPSSTPTGTQPTSTPQPTIFNPMPGDADGDSDVDLQDYNIILSNFGRTGNIPRNQGDLDQNGSVDLQDFNQVISNFGN